jgi:N-dimethylarginine dimethylaminohydrolase
MLNKTVLMSGVDYFDNQAAINPFMNARTPIDRAAAEAEHTAIKQALESAGVTVHQVEPPSNCQDGVYTANWALCRGDKAILATLPNARKAEEPYAAEVFENLGKTVYKVPGGLHFSGQGDALPCGNYLFAGSGYRSDAAAHRFIGDTLGYKVITLQTIPQRHLLGFGKPRINRTSGWPDSFFYDIDLALSVLKAPENGQKGLIAWCPEAFTAASRKRLREFTAVDKLEVAFREAKNAFACNLVSTGQTVIMGDGAPLFKAQLEARGFTVLTPHITELAKGGGYIRCTTLTLDND